VDLDAEVPAAVVNQLSAIKGVLMVRLIEAPK